MLITPPSEPPRRVTALRGACAWFAVLVVLSTGSCFFELPPLDDSVIGGFAGQTNTGGAMPFGGQAGSQGGTSPGGSAGMAGGAGGCPDGQKRCTSGLCLPATPENGCGSSDCASCGSAQHAIPSCIDGQCAVVECEPNFVDCNGDTINKTGLISGDGCEYSLGAPAAPVDNLDLQFAHIQLDGKREDWGTLPSYELKELCSNCVDQQTEPISADGAVPPRNDLDGRFRVAWDDNKLYLLVEAFDEHLFDAGVQQGKCQHPAECEDGVQVFFAGRNNRNGNYSFDNQRLFLGLSNRFGAPGQGQPQSPRDLEVHAEKQSNLCYRIEAQISWGYITATSGGSSAPDFFPPKPGNQYGFNIALNDWDAAISDPTTLQRQSQIFWHTPADDYATSTASLGTITLVGGGDAGQ